MSKLMVYGVALFAAICIGAAAVFFLPRLQQAGQDTATPVVNVEIGGPFELVDHTGQTVTDQDFHGSYMLVFFGYGYCPDVCPFELANIAASLDLLGPLQDRVRPVFITVDPERDTPEFLKEYVEAFHPRLVGLTGNAEQIDKAAKAYRVFYARVEDESSTEYLMDHTSYTYLMDPAGKFATVFGHNTDPETIASSIRKLLESEPTG